MKILAYYFLEETMKKKMIRKMILVCIAVMFLGGCTFSSTKKETVSYFLAGIKKDIPVLDDTYQETFLSRGLFVPLVKEDVLISNTRYHQIRYQGKTYYVLKEYLIEYTFTYQKKELKKKQIVKIVDNKAPEINITGETFTYCPNGKIMPINYEAKDNYDGDLTKDVEITIEEDKIVFSVKDSSDNVTKIFKNAKQEDNEPPVITLNGEQNAYVLLNMMTPKLLLMIIVMMI